MDSSKESWQPRFLRDTLPHTRVRYDRSRRNFAASGRNPIETSLEVAVNGLINVSHRLAGDSGYVFTTYSLLYHCAIVGGEPACSHEAKEVGFLDIDDISADSWFMDMEVKCRVARSYW